MCNNTKYLSLQNTEPLELGLVSFSSLSKIQNVWHYGTAKHTAFVACYVIAGNRHGMTV